jgi:F-type H+-transporting ATPase subunit alpha
MGRVVSIGDGIAWVEGLPSAAMDQILRFENGSEALVFHLGSKRIGAILLGQEDGPRRRRRGAPDRTATGYRRR